MRTRTSATGRDRPRGNVPSCRGRFAYLKVFDRVEIDSTYLDDAGELRQRRFDFDLNYSGNVAEPAVGSGRPATFVRLRAMRPDYAKFVPKEAQTVAREFMSHFLPVLLAASGVEIVIVDGDEEIRLREVFRDDLLIGSRDQPFTIGSRTFTVSLVRLRPKIALRHKLILAASLREVHADNLDKYIPVLATGPLAMAGEPNGLWLVSIVQGSFLNEAVDPMRVTFTDENIMTRIQARVTETTSKRWTNLSTRSPRPIFLASQRRRKASDSARARGTEAAGPHDRVAR